MKQIPVILLGVGGVGQALLRQIVNGRYSTKTRNQINFNIVGVADSQHWQWEAMGLSDEQLSAIVAAKARGDGFGEARPSALDMINQAHEAGLEKVIVVDLTAVNGLEPALDRALELGYSVALANKNALAADWATAQRYFNHPRVRYESTVGGGQPIIATLRYLLDTNDPIQRVEGQLSGSIGFICQQLDRGIPFSQAVAQAKANGATEPDPRQDLSGKDVMRKLLILGRLAGWPLQAADITIEALDREEMEGLTVDRFMAAVSTLDEEIGRRFVTARLRGNVLRYMAEVSAEGGTVSLQEVPMNAPLANMKQISFYTERYNETPLFIGGKGASVEITAAGVVGDMIGLVREGGE